MGLLIRTLLIWLLVLAVPAQGATAATMAFCGPDHHDASPAINVRSDTAAAHGHPVAAGLDKHSHHDMAAQPEDGTNAASSSRLDAEAGHADQQKCSACASCCSVGAILSTALDVTSPAVGATAFSALVLTVDAFAVGGPDRPPRHVLA